MYLQSISVTLVVVVAIAEGLYFPNLRIVGGNDTTIEKHPWMVSIQLLEVHFCGGSIIGPDTILTAAHCVLALVINSYEVLAGITTLDEDTHAYKVAEYIVHNEYDPDTYDFDIAIVKLTEKLNFSTTVQPIALPDENYHPPTGAEVVAAGWGVTSPESDFSNVLQEVGLNVVEWETCKESLYPMLVTDRMICAGYSQGGRDTCNKDSGGPLELNGTLVGIISWGDGCGKATKPGAYTNVAFMRQWIKINSGI